MANPVQSQPFVLFGSGVSLGDNVMTLTTFNGIDGTPLTMADFGTKAFATIEPGSGVQEEQISFTGITVNPDGTRTLTGIKSVTFTTPYTETTGFKKSHAGGTRFVISNTAGFYGGFLTAGNPATVTGLYAFTTSPTVPTPTTGTQAANKAYADALAIAGAPDASTSLKGIAKLTTAPVLATDPIAVGATDVDTTGVSKVIRSKANSLIDDSLLGLTTAGDTVYSDGTDLVRLPKGATGTFVTAGATAPQYSSYPNLPEADTFFGATDITGAEAESLTDGSTLSALHYHKKSYGLGSGNGSTTQNIAHGLGVIPSRIRITAKNYIGAAGNYDVASTSVMANGTAPATIIQHGSAVSVSSTTVVISCHSAGVTRTATAVLNSTNIVLTWSNASNTEIGFLWEAEA